jgi:hypothetical protein
VAFYFGNRCINANGPQFVNNTKVRKRAWQEKVE